MAASRRNERYLPGVELPARVRPVKASELELGRHDLVAFAVPAAELPAVVAEHGPEITQRTGVLVLSKGLVPPLGTLPSAYVAERTRAWATGVLGGPAHAAEALDGGASLVLAAKDDAFARQVSDALAAARLRVDHTTDVIGVELAGCGQERRRARRGRGQPRRPERGRRGGRQGVRRDRRVRARLRLAAGDVRRPGRHRRPRRDRARRGQPQPPRGRAAGAGHARGGDRRRARPDGRGRRGRPAARRPPPAGRRRRAGAQRAWPGSSRARSTPSAGPRA